MAGTTKWTVTTVTVRGIKCPISFPMSDKAIPWNYESSKRFVYAMTYGRGDDVRTKVGITRDPGERLERINGNSPVRVRLCGSWEVQDYAARWVERAAHDLLRDMHSHGEWFKCTPTVAAHAIIAVLPFVPALQKFWDIRCQDPRRWREIVATFHAEVAAMTKQTDASGSGVPEWSRSMFDRRSGSRRCDTQPNGGANLYLTGHGSARTTNRPDHPGSRYVNRVLNLKPSIERLGRT